MSSKRGKLAQRRESVGQSATSITIDTAHLERVPAAELDTPEDVVAFWIPVADIRPSPFQYRYHLDEARLQALMDSIAARELYQPITVRPLRPGKYEVVLGHRRLEAFSRMGRPAIPAIVRDYDDAQTVRALLDENLKRADVNLFEQTEGLVRLLAIELNLTGEPVAAVRRLLEEMRTVKRSGAELNEPPHLKAEKLVQDITGMGWESFLTNRLSVYRLPESLQQEVRTGMPYSLAVAVGRLDPVLHAVALDHLRLDGGQWRPRQDLRAWLEDRRPAASPDASGERLKRIARLAARRPVPPARAARVAALLDELEALLG